MIEIVELFEVFTFQERFNRLLFTIVEDLKDVTSWASKIPDKNKPVHHILAWLEQYPGWKDYCLKRLAMLLDLRELLDKEGFVRWKEAPDDGGIPF